MDITTEVITTIERSLKEKLQENFTDALTMCFYDMFIIQLLANFFEEFGVKLEDQDLFFKYIQKIIKFGTYEKYPNFEIFQNHLDFTKKIKSKYKKDLDIDNFDFIGDPHRCIYKIKTNSTVIYENILGVNKLVEKVIEIYPEFKQLIPQHDYINENKYVSRKYIDYDKQVTDFNEYFYNWGKTFAFVFFLRMIDINSDNFLLLGNNQLLFDIEFIAFPQFNNYLKRYDAGTASLIVSKRKGNNSALLASFSRQYNVTRPHIFLNKKTLSIKWQKYFSRNRPNMPTNLGTAYPMNYQKELYKGMMEATQILMSRKKQFLELFRGSDCISRCMIRPTAAYRYALMSLAYNEDANGIDTVIRNELSNLKYYGFNVPDEKKLLDSEIDNLRNYLIPYYTMSINKRDMYDSKGNVVGYLDETPFETLEKHVNKFEKFINKQCKAISNVLVKDYVNMGKWKEY
jgi:hypothetical protein